MKHNKISVLSVLLLLFPLINLNYSYSKPIDLKIKKNSKLIRLPQNKEALVKEDKKTSSEEGFNFNYSKITWNDLDQGKQLSSSIRKPSLVVFYTDWCPHCKKYSQVFNSPSIVELSKKFVMIKVNTDKVALDNKYSPDGGYIPRTIFLDKDFEPDYTFNNNRKEYKFFFDNESKNELESVMKKVLAKYK